MTNGSPVLRTRPPTPRPGSIRRPITAAVRAPETAATTAAWPPRLHRRDEREVAAGQLAGAVGDALEHHRVVEPRGELAPDRFERLGLLPAAVALRGGAQPVDGHGGQVRDAATQRGLGRAERRSVAAPDQQRADRLPGVDHRGRDPGGEAQTSRRGSVAQATSASTSVESTGARRSRARAAGAPSPRASSRVPTSPGGTAVARDQPQARLAVDPQEDRGQVGAGRGARDGGDVRHRLVDRGRLQQTAKGRQGLPLARAHVVPRSARECPRGNRSICAGPEPAASRDRRAGTRGGGRPDVQVATALNPTRKLYALPRCGPSSQHFHSHSGSLRP